MTGISPVPRSAPSGRRRRPTSIKTRIVAHQQQVVRVDRESRGDLDRKTVDRILSAVEKQLPKTSALVLGDYGKGGVTQSLLDGLKELCTPRGVWISLDPKPIHAVNISGLSLITPNRKEAFELAGMADEKRGIHPLKDVNLMKMVRGLQR